MMQRILTAVSAILLAAWPASAEPTEIVVRVISQDAKFVGDSMGGAEVVLRDSASGAVIAQGVTAGGTGDTPSIMAATGRSPLRATDSAASFRATVDIDRPTLVRVEVRGPLGFPQTIQRASSERWLVPGLSAAAGEGWVVELPGLAIRLLGSWQSGLRQGVATEMTAEVQLMCGCPITPGGLWNAADYDVVMQIRRDDRVLQTVKLTFAEAPGQFRARWTPGPAGTAEVTIIARNRITGNTGVLTEQGVIR